MENESAFRPVLTPRESEILGLIASGWSAKETAARLGITPRTVEQHAENIRLKIGARNRVHMVKRAIVLGELRFGGQSGALQR